MTMTQGKRAPTCEHVPCLTPPMTVRMHAHMCWSLVNPQRSAAGGGGEGGGPRLWVVTRGAVVTGKADRLGSLSASLWAMARSAMFEAPGLWAALVDVQVRGSSGVRAILLLPVQVMRLYPGCCCRWLYVSSVVAMAGQCGSGVG